MPAEIDQQIRQYNRAQVVSGLKLTAELYRLIEMFREAGLETMLVKGPSVAVRAYANGSARAYGDLDLLVRHRDIQRATELMTAAGYRPDISLDAIRADKIPGQYLFVHARSALIVEFHTERTMRYFPRRLPIERFFDARAEVMIDGRAVPTLSLEDELVLICIHGSKHVWDRLAMIADVAAYVARQPQLDWKKVFQSAEEIGATRMLHLGLVLARDLLHTPIPQNVSATINNDSAAQQLAEQVLTWLPSAGRSQPGLLARVRFRVRMRGALPAGLSYLLRLTLSPTQEDWLSGDKKAQSGIMGSLRRPFRLAKKYGTDRK